MALPTQFSVTSVRSSPIPNPNPPLRVPLPAAPQPVSATPTPTPLAPSVTDDFTPPFPRNHARILYENQLEQYNTITISGGSDKTLTIVPNTWQRWSFTATGSDAIQYDMGAVFSADTICIGAHNLEGSTIDLFYDPDTSPLGFILIESREITSNQPIMFHLDSSVDYGRLQFNIEGASGEKFIGYIAAGIALQMQRPFFNGHVPITDGDVTRYYSNRTESGEIIGQQIRSQGYETDASWQNIDDAWYRTYFAPFKQAAKTRPFFIAWNLLEYPEDVGFCRISQDINAPMQNGFNIRRSIDMKLLGHG